LALANSHISDILIGLAGFGRDACLNPVANRWQEIKHYIQKFKEPQWLKISH